VTGKFRGNPVSLREGGCDAAAAVIRFVSQWMTAFQCTPNGTPSLEQCAGVRPSPRLAKAPEGPIRRVLPSLEQHCVRFTRMYALRCEAYVSDGAGMGDRCDGRGCLRRISLHDAADERSLRGRMEPDGSSQGPSLGRGASRMAGDS
jgi:hypothetical protein